MTGPRPTATFPFDTVTELLWPESALTIWACASVLPCTQSRLTAWLATILATVLWMNPLTAPAIDPEKLDSRPPSLGKPLADSCLAAWIARPCTLSLVVTAVVILSVSAPRTAGELISGETVCTYREVLETWFAVHTPSTETGARTQASVMSSADTGPCQLIRRRPARPPAPAARPRAGACASASLARSSAISARSSESSRSPCPSSMVCAFSWPFRTVTGDHDPARGGRHHPAGVSSQAWRRGTLGFGDNRFRGRQCRVLVR